MIKPKPNHDSTEFITLLTNHQTALRGLIVSFLPGCQDVSDILQETNIVLWEKKNSYKPGTNFQAWAFAVARNKVMKYWDKQKKANKIVLSEKLVLAVAEAKAEETPEIVDKQLSALNHCLKNLKQGERDLLDARYAETSAWDSYLMESESSSGSLRVTLYRIRKKLRRCIEIRVKGERV